MLSSASALGRAALLLDEPVDLGIGDADARLHLALAHALDQDLVAQVAAKAREVDALGLQPLAQLRPA